MSDPEGSALDNRRPGSLTTEGGHTSADAAPLAELRATTRAWLEANCPPSMRTPMASEAERVWGGRHAVFPSEDARLWLERMAARGWTAPRWPTVYGGGGLDAAAAEVLDEELRRIGARTPLVSFGLWMLGPLLLEYGNEEQRRQHLPPIVRGEIRWCQGYSEPGAGSDLAGLQTRALRDGDDYVVDGQKVWTSYADKADWMFCLVRTDPSVPKHDGIGFLLIDMATPGISTRPIRLISGRSPFCETFFDHVRVPARNLVGQPGQGWTLAKALLRHERARIAQASDAVAGDDTPLEALAARYVGLRDGRIADPVLRDRITQVNLDRWCNRLTLRRALEGEQARGAPGPESSLVKLYGAELNKRRCELGVQIAGANGLGWEGDGFDAGELERTREWLRSRANSIEGGTSEIQLNIIAKLVLGLPMPGDGEGKGRPKP